MPRSLAADLLPLRLLAALLALGSVGCVIGRPARPSLAEAAQGPSAAAVTGSPVVPHTSPVDGDDAPKARARPGATWVRGYWHWEGVRYVWERARWEPTAAPATAP